MSDQDLAAICDELERHDREMTAAPWREWAEPTGTGCEWKDSLPPGSTCVESTGTIFALGVAVCATPGENSRDVDGIAYLRNNAARIASELRRLMRVEASGAALVSALTWREEDGHGMPPHWKLKQIDDARESLRAALRGDQ